jgi:LysR family transcriptional activator of nhaA
MKELNYNHLYYFWVVVREGSIAAARAKLHVTQPTISVQLGALEEALGQQLFDRRGRRLVLTEVGRVVYRYASDIFALGRELVANVEKGVAGGSAKQRLTVGVADVLPKLVTSRLLAPVLRLDLPVQVVCYEGKPPELLARLAMHELDLVLSDHPIDAEASIRAHTHPLGKSGMTFLAPERLARRYRGGFPESLDGAPLLLPTRDTALRRALDQWFDKMGLHPDIVAEFEDSALLKAFSQVAQAVFPVSSLIAASVRTQYGAHLVGETTEVLDHLYGITIDKKLKHPAVVAVVETAREALAD